MSKFTPEARIELFENLQKGEPFDYMNQKILFRTNLFGKEYYWMEDYEGTTYLVKSGEDGLPDFT